MDGGGAVELAMEPFTALDDYLAWAETRPDEEHYEVVDGVAVMSPSPSRVHQRALSRLLVLLANALPPNLEALQLRQPDLVVVPCRVDDGPRLVAPPLFAVEILSPTSFERDAVAKRREYAVAGLEHYWIVDPQIPQLGVFRRSGDQLELVAHAHGDHVVAVDQPLAVRVRPTDLVV